MKLIYLAATCVVLLPAAAAFGTELNESLDRAEVTLPFAEVRQLLAAATQPADPPPIPSAVTAVVVRVNFHGGVAAGTAECDVAVFAAGWQMIPLLGMPLALDSVEPADATVLVRNGMLCLLTDQPGRTRVKLTFAAGSDRLTLQIPPVAVGRLEVAGVPDGMRVAVSGAASFGTGSSYSLPAEGGALDLQLIGDEPVVATNWTVIGQTVARQVADRIQFVVHLRLAGESGTGNAANAVLPENASKTNVSGDDLGSNRITVDGDGAKWLVLHWETPGVLERTVVVKYELPLPESGDRWNLATPVIEGAPPARNLFAVVPGPGVELTGAGGAITGTAELPIWMQEAVTGENPFVVRSEGPFSLVARKLAILETATARIPGAHYAVRMVPGGELLCEAKVRVEHRGGLRWRFVLPAESTLLTCAINGVPTNPLVRDDGGLELPISAGRKSDQTVTSDVTFSYTARGVAFAPMQGRLAVSLPATPLFIENVALTLSLPEAYEATAFDGNVEPVTGEPGGGLHFRKRLVRDEAPALEIHYRKRDLNL